MNPTIAVPQESIFVWLSHFFSSMQFQELWVYLLVGFFGIFLHYINKVISKEFSGSFYKYLIGDHPAQTVTALSTFVVSAFTFVFSGTIESASWPTIISLALTVGYSLDSAINKSTPPEFTNQK